MERKTIVALGAAFLTAALISRCSEKIQEQTLGKQKIEAPANQARIIDIQLR